MLNKLTKLVVRVVAEYSRAGVPSGELLGTFLTRLSDQLLNRLYSTEGADQAIAGAALAMRHASFPDELPEELEGEESLLWKGRLDTLLSAERLKRQGYIEIRGGFPPPTTTLWTGEGAAIEYRLSAKMLDQWGMSPQ